MILQYHQMCIRGLHRSWDQSIEILYFTQSSHQFQMGSLWPEPVCTFPPLLARETQAISKGSVTSKRQRQVCCLLQEPLWTEDQPSCHGTSRGHAPQAAIHPETKEEAERTVTSHTLFSGPWKLLPSFSRPPFVFSISFQRRYGRVQL